MMTDTGTGTSPRRSGWAAGASASPLTRGISGIGKAVPMSVPDRSHAVDLVIAEDRETQSLLLRRLDRRQEAVDVYVPRSRAGPVEGKRPHQHKFGPVERLAEIAVRSGLFILPRALDDQPTAPAL